MRKVLEGLIDGQFFCPYSNRDVTSSFGSLSMLLPLMAHFAQLDGRWRVWAKAKMSQRSLPVTSTWPTLAIGVRRWRN
ncbi:hypothetical protein [Pseudomonas aeruginosa]|uniref:hypothetical protein n=1 Tax=Pseudomonas aeruginosa TaxID=287 RepID=UPI001ABD3575|nr:hypothetical protein [Pseudomonas aeruginosa]